MNKEHFEPFPTNRPLAEPRGAHPVIHNPHHPDPSKRVTGGPKPAVQGMTLAAPGTPPPQATPRTQRPPAPQMEQPASAPMAPQAFTAEPLPVTVVPNSEAEAVSFALPSNFLFYEFKDLYIRPFKGRHFSKLHRAHEEESLLHVVEAVSAVVSSTTGPQQGLAFYLTLPDFYACLYWLRMHSFLKHGFTHQTMCRSKKHQEAVEKGELSTETLKHAETLTKTSLKTKVLENPIDVSAYQLDYPGLRLVPATMKEVLEITMNENIDRFAARVAASFQFMDRDAPLVERMAIVDDLSGDDIATLRAFETASSAYGVEESIQWTCRTCGHKHTDEIQLEAHSFFPSAA